MTIQSQLNQLTINSLSKIKQLINQSEKFEANQMIHYTLRACNNSKISIDNMNEKELNDFQNDLIETFKYKNWIN